MKGKVWVETPRGIEIPEALVDIVKKLFWSLGTTDLVVRVMLTPALKLRLQPGDGKLRLSYRTNVSADAPWAKMDVGVNKRFWNSYTFPTDPMLVPRFRRLEQDQPSRFPPPQPPAARTSIWQKTHKPSSAALRLAEYKSRLDPETAGEIAEQKRNEPARAWHQVSHARSSRSTAAVKAHVHYYARSP